MSLTYNEFCQTMMKTLSMGTDVRETFAAIDIYRRSHLGILRVVQRG